MRGSVDCSEELYFGSPSFLISAGGQPTDFAYRADVPLPTSVLVGAEDHRGVVAPTT
jgi:hypothetical protein